VPCCLLVTPSPYTKAFPISALFFRFCKLWGGGVLVLVLFIAALAWFFAYIPLDLECKRE